jgi:16S rRNA (cytosine1402-N4)-methyltransferase
MNEDNFSHITVLLDEAVEGLVQIPEGVYIDGTFGRGGHSGLILKQLNENGRLIAIDKDPEARKRADELFAGDSRFKMQAGSFAQLEEFCEAEDLVGKLDGVLLDLGVSSPQLDDASRGFSFMKDGPLDMRMDPDSGESAAQWIARASEEEIADVIYTYGEERYSRRMAKSIVYHRADEPIVTTKRLAEIVKEAHPKWEKGKHPATKAFQGIRIFINSELEDLEKCLDQSLDMLKVGGRLVVISFHSLEDRIVKRFIRLYEKGKQVPRDIPVMNEDLNLRLKSIGKAVKPSKNEVGDNVRSRSAVMRMAVKLK